MRVEWDVSKSIKNRKHGVSFEEAAALLTQDSDYLQIFDEPHSDEEDRFIASV